jgi:chemotaxis protein CheY-P-specific phosphatase CheC
VDASEVAIKLMLMVEEGYTLDDAIADYKKVIDAVGGSITIGSSSNTASNVLGKTGGRNVPVVKHQDIKSKLNQTIAASSGTAVQTSMVQF